VSANPDELQVKQASWMQQPKRWPLVNTLMTRDNQLSKATRLVNAYGEKDPMLNEYQVEKRPGLSAAQYSLGGNGEGLFMQDFVSPSIPGVNQNLYIVQGGILYLVRFAVAGGFPPTTTSLGPLTAMTFGPQIFFGPITPYNSRLLQFGWTVSFASIPDSSASNLIFGNGSATYYLAAGGVPTLLGNGQNFPGFVVPGIVYLDGTTYVMDFFGAIYGSLNLNDPTVWDPLNKIVANNYPDTGVYLARQLTYVIAIKRISTQVFFDNGNPTGSPLSPLPGAIFKFGCISPDTVQSLGDVLFWVTCNEDYALQVVKLDNLQPQVISDPSIDKLLTGSLLNGLSTQFRSVIFERGGHKFYVVTIVDNNLTLVYDIDQGLWYQWTDTNGNYYRTVSATYDQFGRLLTQDINDGNIYLCDTDYVYPNDHGLIATVDIYTPNYDAGIDRIKSLSQIRFNADQTAGSKLQVRFSDNDYQSFNNFRTVDLARERPILNDEGSFYRRAYHFRHQCNTKLRIRAAELQMDIGTL
jgi:hypothetical protein